MDRLIRLAKVWWLTVPEPRVFSLGWGAAYLMLGCAGLLALVDPPLSLIGSAGWLPVVLSLGGLNVLGMFISMTSGWCDFWKGERLGLAFMLGAAGIYAGLIVTLQLHESGNRWVQFFYVAFTLVVLGLRYLMIRWYTFRPREG